METKREIVEVKAADYGLEESKAAGIKAMFVPMLNKMEELEVEYNSIIALPVSQEICDKAHALRLKYVKVRTGTAEIHKQAKDFYLKGGKFVDGWKNAQLFASQSIEEKLEKIEKHYEILAAEKRAKLIEERTIAISPYMQIVETQSLGDMTDDVFNNLLSGAKLVYDNKILAEKKAEDERIAKEKAEIEERERIRVENERLKQEAIIKEKELLAQRAKAEEEKRAAEKLLAEQKAKADKERLEAEAKAKQEQDRILAEQKAKAESDRKIAEEKSRKEKVELEAKAKLEREKLLAEQKIKLEMEEKMKLMISKYSVMQILDRLIKIPEANDIDKGWNKGISEAILRIDKI